MDLQIGDKVLFNGIEYKVTQFFMGIYWGRAKYAREETELPLNEVTLVKSIKKQEKIKEPPPIKITGEERGQILKSLVEPESLRDNFQREIMILAKLIRKFPHKEFLLEGFKPAIKANSLLYWINRPEVEQLYKNWALDLSTKVEPIKLETEKVGTDIIIEKKRPKNLLDLLS
jgi:hypothetical protein